MGIPTDDERRRVEREAANGNRLAQQILKNWAKEARKAAKKAKKKK